MILISFAIVVSIMVIAYLIMSLADNTYTTNKVEKPSKIWMGDSKSLYVRHNGKTVSLHDMIQKRGRK